MTVLLAMNGRTTLLVFTQTHAHTQWSVLFEVKDLAQGGQTYGPWVRSGGFQLSPLDSSSFSMKDAGVLVHFHSSYTV